MTLGEAMAWLFISYRVAEALGMAHTIWTWMAAGPVPRPICRYCGSGGGSHSYDCPVLRDTGTAAPGRGKWWKKR